MNQGFIKIWRKSLDGGWLQNPVLWTFWSWCLLKASHKIIVVKISFQEVTLQPGQFIFGRKKASEELRMSEWKIRSCLDFLRKAGNLTIKTTNKFSIISITNWNSYQGEAEKSSQQNHQQPTSNPPQTRMNKNEKNNPNEISKEISEFIRQVFPSVEGMEMFKKTLKAISSTRKTKQIAPTVVLKLLHEIRKYPEGQIIAGMKTYLERDYCRQGKKEAYLLGIIRNQKIDFSTGQKLKTTGSSLLDSYYQNKVAGVEGIQ
jgi:hypothetical protein